MNIGKESAPKNEEQGNLDFRSEEEKKRALIDRVLEERINGTFSVDSLSKEDREIYLGLLEDEREEDKDYHGHEKRKKSVAGRKE